MNPALNTLHFLYSLLAVLFLLIAATVNAATTNQPLLPLLFLPLIFHFVLATYRRLYAFLSTAAAAPPRSFHLLFFFTQDNPLFLITLGLLILAFTMTIIRGFLLP